MLSCFCNRNIKYLLDEEKERPPKKKDNYSHNNKGKLSIDCSGKKDEEEENVVVEFVPEVNYEKIFMDILNLFKNNNVDLINAYESLGYIIREKTEDDIIDEIFSKFCMGK